MKVIIIIPTYNEKENIGLLIDSLQNQFMKIPHDMNILVVDDHSPDGTAEIVKLKSKKYSNVHLITGKKEGLGAAYIRGMKYAIDQLYADWVMEMDADFSHNPEDVPRMISNLDKGYDFIIGSRYVKGGKIPANWSFKRKMISKWGNIFSRFIAGLYKVNDCTAGFRAIRVSLLNKLNLADIKVQGYAFQMALLHRAMISQAKIIEIPVTFIDRVRGETKLSFLDVFEFIVNAWWIRFESSKTFVRFAIVGAVGVFVNLGTFTILISSGLNKYIASPISIEVSIVLNFLINNFWTFADRENKDYFHLKGLKFNIVSLISLGVSYSTFVSLSFLFPDIMPQFNQAIGIIPATVVNYFLNSYWTFKAAITTYHISTVESEYI